MGVISKALKEDGILGLFRGLHLTLLREIPGTCIWFMAYELALKPFYRYGYQKTSIPLSGIILAGSIRYGYHSSLMCSGATYWSMIYPIDTLKSIVQTDSSYAQSVKGKGMREVTRYIYRLIGYSLGKG